jgi:hypothetical protein
MRGGKRSRASLILLAALAGASVTADLGRVVDTPLPFFSASGSTAEVVRKLARASFLQGVYGFENVEGSAQQIAVTASDTSAGSVLREICRQDPRYQVVETGDPEIVDLMASDERSPGHRVLEFRIPRLDIEATALSEDLITRLADYSPELRAYLMRVYVQAGGKTTAEPGAVGGMAASARLPHFSIHLKDVSVREALNSIAAQSFRLYKAAGRDPRVVHTADELAVAPSGWEFDFQSPKDLSFARWTRAIFRFLE